MFFRKPGLAIHTLVYLGYAVVYFVAYLVASLVIGVTREDPDMLARRNSALSIILMIGLFAVFVWLIVLIGLTRVAIPKPSFRRRFRDEYD